MSKPAPSKALKAANANDVRACVVPSHLTMSHNMMDEKSELVAQAYSTRSRCVRKRVSRPCGFTIPLASFHHTTDRSGNFDEQLVPIAASHAPPWSQPPARVLPIFP